MRTPQSIRQHSHRKPAVGWPLSIHLALRWLRFREQASFWAMRSSCDIGNAVSTRAREQAPVQLLPQPGGFEGLGRGVKGPEPNHPGVAEGPYVSSISWLLPFSRPYMRTTTTT